MLLGVLHRTTRSNGGTVRFDMASLPSPFLAPKPDPPVPSALTRQFVLSRLTCIRAEKICLRPSWDDRGLCAAPPAGAVSAAPVLGSRDLLGILYLGGVPVSKGPDLSLLEGWAGAVPLPISC